MGTTKRKRKGFRIMPVFMVLAVLAAGLFLVKRYAPTRTVIPLTEVYPVSEGEVLVVMQDAVMEQRGICADGIVYLEYQQTVDMLNQRFYWDSHENLMIYTTPLSVIKVKPGESKYVVNKNKKKTEYEILQMRGDKVYLALDFIKQYTELEYQLYEEPGRVVITYQYGQEFLFTTAKKDTPIRNRAGIKSGILTYAKAGSRLQCLDEGAENVNGFLHVITEDGVRGYISARKAEKPFSEILVSEGSFQPETYTHISKDYKINMVWHQVYNQEANEQLIGMMEKTEGVNTISPTWFRITGTEGEISSLASESYVKRAHAMGIEVWALITDVDEAVDMYEILSYTSKREKIEKKLLAQAIQYELDGINIDFETISEEVAPSYLQFIRELGIKCRKNDIVLSIDNYVPTEYSAYYDRREQAEAADYIITMAYDEHYSGGGESGSVASIGYVETAIENSLREVPKEQLILGIPFYTRLWKEEAADDGTVSVTAESYGMASSWNKIKEEGVEPSWDEETGQYYGEYERDGAIYKMWLEDEKSIGEKLKRAHDSDIAGTSAWKLGMEKQEVWAVIQKYMN